MNHASDPDQDDARSPPAPLELFPMEPSAEDERVWVHGYWKTRNGKPVYVDGHWRRVRPR